MAGIAAARALQDASFQVLKFLFSPLEHTYILLYLLIYLFA